MTDEVLDLLRTLRDEVRELRDEVRALGRRAGSVRPAPPPGTAEHLRAIAADVEGRTFSVSELLAHAALPDRAALRAAIVGLAGSPNNGRRLGKLLRRIEGRDFGGLTVERVGADRYGAIWALRVSGV